VNPVNTTVLQNNQLHLCGWYYHLSGSSLIQRLIQKRVTEFAWQWSCKQHIIARFSSETEFRSLALKTEEHMNQVAPFWRCRFLAPLLYSLLWICDNQSAVAVSHNPVLHSITKHMELDFYFLHERLLPNSLNVVHVPSLDQLTFLLSVSQMTDLLFQSILDKIKVPSSLIPPWEDGEYS
jgi:hypothetical protein